MTWLEDIGAYLHTQNMGTVGVDIFYDKLKAGVPNCIAIMAQPGQDTKYTLGKTMTLKRPELGIRVRNVSPEEAEKKASEIHDMLDLTFNKIIGSTRFKSIRATAPHFPISQSKITHTIYSINFELRIG